MCARFYDLAIPFSAHLINGDVTMISTCASTVWYYCTAEIFPDMVLARFPFDSIHHAAKSIKAQLISSGDVFLRKQTYRSSSTYKRRTKTGNLTRSCIETIPQRIFQRA